MAFSRPTLAAIIDRIESDMESRLTGNTSLLRRALLRILARVFAGAIHIVYGFLTFWGEQLFVATAETEYLDRHGFMWGVTRKAAAFATGITRFNGVNGTLVPSGTRVQTEDGVEFETTGSGNIAGGYTELPTTAVEPGVAGNIASATVLELIEPITGVTDALAAGDFANGVDEESDDDYRERILLRIQEPPAGGTAEDYERWALEVPGVSGAWCFPITPGPGQVTLIYRGTASIPTVYDYLAERMPVTTDLTVDVTDDEIVDMTIALDPNSTAMQDNVQANLDEFFATQAAPGENLLRTQLDNAISTAGVTDFSITSITGAVINGRGDLVFTGFQYPLLGTVTFTTLT